MKYEIVVNEPCQLSLGISVASLNVPPALLIKGSLRCRVISVAGVRWDDIPTRDVITMHDTMMYVVDIREGIIIDDFYIRLEP